MIRTYLELYDLCMQLHNFQSHIIYTYQRSVMVVGHQLHTLLCIIDDNSMLSIFNYVWLVVVVVDHYCRSLRRTSIAIVDDFERARKQHAQTQRHTHTHT